MGNCFSLKKDNESDFIDNYFDLTHTYSCINPNCKNREAQFNIPGIICFYCEVNGYQKEFDSKA